MANSYDATVKELVWAGAPALLRMLAGDRVASFLSAEFSSVRQRRPDMVAELDGGGLFHVEFQVGREDMAWRMLEYYALISRHHGGAPVTQLVLHLGERGEDGPPGIRHPNLTFRYEVRYIADLDAGPLLDSPAPEDAVLAILCRCDDIRERVRCILARLAPLPRRERSDAAAKLLILSQLRRATPVVKEELETMAIQFNIKEHPYLSEVFAQGLAEGKAEGREEGEAKGRAEALLRLVERRRVAVPEDTERRIRAATVADLDRWFDAVLDASDLTAADLDAILASPPHH
ncbi:DUF4351 domain-containing protein [Skermanella rosea]|uniref:hypothetical protein n=1 Tax=Skermanella rosea TaxID=1817965 RepID=UPI0019313987|nr:hypothetical protein [Skermanella rosea]UEM01285.1 DUF4351 domain-containing protein [Skermanella rosea]